jgi:alpha-1,2-mannosyltransferase
VWQKLRSGAWLTPERVRAYLRILMSIAAVTTIATVAFPNVVGPEDLPLGADFSQVWVAGKEVRAGAPNAPYDFSRHIAAQRTVFGENTGVFGWHYPPYFLAPAALLADLPYLVALAIWQLSTLCAYLWVVAPILTGAGLRRRDALVTALAFPAVFVNLVHGQNGFLTAALLGAGFRLLDSRPWAAGGLFALLAYKPHFMLVLPLALVIERRWRALIAAGFALLVMTGASIFAFGVGAWRAFFDSLRVTRLMSEQGAAGFEKIQSVFAATRLLGASVEAAYAIQGLIIVVVFGALIRLLRSAADPRVKAAATITAMFLTTPYVLDYDMAALGPALAFLLAHGLEKGFAPYEKTILAVAYAIPLVARPFALATGLPLGALTTLALFASTVRLLNDRQS